MPQTGRPLWKITTFVYMYIMYDIFIYRNVNSVSHFVAKHLYECQIQSHSTDCHRMVLVFLYLFFVPGFVNFLLQDVHSLERVHTVDAVHQNKAVSHGVVVFRQLLAIVEPPGVI